MFRYNKFNRNLDNTDVIKFYCLNSKLNKLSDITCVITKNYKQILKFLKNKYKDNYSIFTNDKKQSIVITKDDFIEKYIVINDLTELNDCPYKFKRYI